ncbi:helix-turn-helix domain-containing protein [Agaribacter marinus]|uniref:AraC family transcriptional regulator n=1 Tax=Agaribacter marinus TaxID=1431249 RepID=A0AA37SYR4_9ALTE|nr:helix-turn-helix domain-containing protein [Agaribacter marinus]GLR71782.1 AraC family transcriptional regulator [Agaribacter marinus]
MRENLAPISGIFHNKDSQKVKHENYSLRRYFPNDTLAPYIEQFWFVDWQFPNGQTHVQKNLPDPNPNLLFKNDEMYLFGPIDGRFEYKMEGIGSIVGVKFHVGVLPQLGLSFFEKYKASHMVNRQYAIDEIFDLYSDALFSFQNTLAQKRKAAPQTLCGAINDKSYDDDHYFVNLLQEMLPKLLATRPILDSRAQKILDNIKHQSIYKVDALAAQMDISVRQLQRICKDYIGLSPKWLIRKYRMHGVLKLIDDGEASIVDAAAMLDYTDQSHLMRDFQTFIGQTPTSYKSE